MKNSHFIPRLILRHFSSKKDRICLFDLKTGVFRPDVKFDKAFAIDGYYPDDVEEEFNRRTEGEFGNLLNNVILASKDKVIRLDRTQVQKIKKFLLLLIIRSMHQDAWIEGEKRFEETMERLDAMHGITDNFLFPFKERKIEGESVREYWIRSLRCILDSQYGLPEEIENDPNATQMAWRWAWVIKSGFLGFWSNKGTNVDFLVTDIGMTSESEMAVGKDMTWNPNKLHSLIACAEQVADDPEMDRLKTQFWTTAARQAYFHENFMEFPITKELMIVLINPYYKDYAMYKTFGFPFAPVETLTKLNNKRAYAPNKAIYVKEGEFLDGDRYEYEIHNMTRENCIYLNLLTLDRIDATLGFANPEKILSSLESYQLVPGKLNDYSKLIRQIKGGQ